ncbi:CPLN2 protein, partial [Rhodinocichla rosea]|nr:CPLN2 protein [Rhodinocichla rosea]
PGWLLSPAGRPYLDSILHKNQRRVFGACPPCAPQPGSQPPRMTPSLSPGLLERPALPPALAVPTVTYKLFLAGRSGVGKTALVAWLGGTPAPLAHHETLGIEATTLFWPAKPRGSGRPVLFQLHLWD